MPANLSIDELVAVNSLLIERETCLADLSHIEATISDILGQPYPFPKPAAELPSIRKGKRPPQPKKARKEPNKKIPKIRRLKPDESAYRVTLLERGEQRTLDLLDFSPFQDLLDHPLPHSRILSVTTLDSNLAPADPLLTP